MGQRAQVKNLAQIGIVSDIEPYELPSNAWTDGNNISFKDGGVKRVYGHVEVLSPAVDKVMRIHTKDRQMFYTTKDSVYRVIGTSQTKINKGGTAYPIAGSWDIDELSEVVVFTPDTSIPQYLPVNGTELKDLPAWDAAWRTKVIRAHKNFLVALATTEGGQEFTQRVRWSDITPPNAPPASWDATSTTNSAGFNDLTDATGTLIDAKELGNNLMLYTDQEVFAMVYVGGSTIFDFPKVLDNVNLLARGCVATVDGGHFVVTTNDVIVHNGNSFQSIIRGKVKERLFDSIRNTDTTRVRVQPYPAKDEVWVMYPSQPTAPVDSVAVYSTLNNTWSFRDIPACTYSCYGTIPKGSPDIIDNQTMKIDSDTRLIDSVGKDFISAGLFLAGNDLKWYAMDEGLTTPGNKSLRAFIERTYIDLDDLGAEPDSFKQVMGIRPQVSGKGNINVYVGVSDTPYQRPEWSRPVQFSIENDYKADFRATGRYISVRFESLDDSNWALMGYSIDLIPRGSR